MEANMYMCDCWWFSEEKLCGRSQHTHIHTQMISILYVSVSLCVLLHILKYRLLNCFTSESCALVLLIVKQNSRFNHFNACI